MHDRRHVAHAVGAEREQDDYGHESGGERKSKHLSWIQIADSEICWFCARTLHFSVLILSPQQIKCEQYWPDTEDQYGKFKVALGETEQYADYTIKKFTVTREVSCLHFPIS